MDITDQLEALLGQQGMSAVERDLLDSDIQVYDPATTSPGINSTFYVLLAGGTEAFHKPFAGVSVSTAGMYGHEPDQVPLNECFAWRLVAALGAPYSDLAPVCVLRSIHGEAGSLSLRQLGEAPGGEPFLDAPEQCEAAAFFDALIAQQDRHLGNFRWDAEASRLGLIDHSYAFACPGDYVNATAFVAWRHAEAREALSERERGALTAVAESSDLLGLAELLAPARAEALRGRAEAMLRRGMILEPGEF